MTGLELGLRYSLPTGKAGGKLDRGAIEDPPAPATAPAPPLPEPPAPLLASRDAADPAPGSKSLVAASVYSVGEEGEGLERPEGLEEKP